MVSLDAIRHRLRKMDNAFGRHGIKPGKQEDWEQYLADTLHMLREHGQEAGEQTTLKDLLGSE